MAALPRDVAEHLEAAIQLSNRHTHLRFLAEADLLLANQHPVAAIVVAGVVLETFAAGVQRDVSPHKRQQLETWSELRNRAIDSGGQGVTPQEAAEMVEGVRGFLLEGITDGPGIASEGNSPERVRGKYKFVPTSSADFIARKQAELLLEH